MNDNLGVAYPIVNGMPCLNPKLGILLEDKESADETGGTEDESESIADK